MGRPQAAEAPTGAGRSGPDRPGTPTAPHPVDGVGEPDDTDAAGEITRMFWALHEGLPRQSAGSDATTRRLLELAGPLPHRPRALDIGCGPGRAALVLAQAAGADVVAVDLHRPFLTQLAHSATAAGTRDRIRPVVASMTDLPCPDSAFDLVWSEGSAYIMGFAAALRAWRRLLAPAGTLVVSEPVWTVDDPAPPVKEFWDAAYPLRSAEATADMARAAGYEVVAAFEQPDSDWWAEYYDPLTARLDRAERAGTATADDRAALDACRAEITLRRAHGADYGYLGFVLRPRRD
ncbi:class I SAM-dependent methyltransferase [Frankia sp. EAN1pec]|uniref:methyltransferase domain-containing protein n=1 Tax=Parafrankia sp. (strain EAN1pec) TaxID=298653 RepID=UPI0018DB2657